MKLFVSEDEINHLLPDLLPDDLPVEGIRLSVQPEGLVVQGTYPALGFRVAFDMLWVPAVLESGAEARLQNLSVAGFGASKLRGLLIKIIRDAIGDIPGIQVADDRAIVDLPELLSSYGTSARIEITAIRCLSQALEIETKIG